MFLYFRQCNDDQLSFQEFSAKVSKISYKAMVVKMKELFPKCKSSAAWRNENDKLYEECTLSISSSNSKIQENIAKIEIFSVHQKWGSLASKNGECAQPDFIDDNFCDDGNNNYSNFSNRVFKLVMKK